jgi:hypothetical protein
MSNGTFDFNLFLKESKETLLNPKSYFSTMKTTGGITEPLIKAVIYGTISGIFALLWSILRIGAITGGLLGGTFGFMAFVWAIIAAVIGLFIGAVILLIISSICTGNTDFEANVRVSASLMVIMPIMYFFRFAAGLNLYLGLIISLVLGIYAIWMLYHGLVESLKCKAETAKIVCYVLIALVVLFVLLGLSTRNRFERSLNRYNREIRKELNKN